MGAHRVPMGPLARSLVLLLIPYDSARHNKVGPHC